MTSRQISTRRYRREIILRGRSNHHTPALSDLSIAWKPALPFAFAISLLILGLFYYWFAIADRYAVFLYGHLGATPFDHVTSSRYWMSGLVACGAVMITYTMGIWLLGRVAAFRQAIYAPPAWWRIWLLCVPFLAIGIPVITMRCNAPVLPPLNALTCLLATVVGLALALMPGALAAQRPGELLWLMADGAGLMPSLLLLRAVELPARGLIGVGTARLVAIGSLLAGALWLGAMTALRMWRHKAYPAATALFVTGLCQSYLLMPLIHHLFFTPARYRYISASSNFFAFSAGLQALVFLAAAALAVGTARLRRIAGSPGSAADHWL